MSFPINTGIPNANNYPGDDQPGMQTNFSNINSYLAVDHVTPGLTGNGEHKQITFNNNNVPVPPITSPIGVLFTNIQDGAGNALPGSVSELFYYVGTAAQSKNQYVSQPNGSVLLLGGIILKWGSSAVTNSSNSFPVAFPNNAFAMFVTSTDAALGSPLKVTALSPTAFTVTRSGSGATGYYYLAIGN